MYPYSNPGVLARSISALKNIKWGALLDGTQKTLGVINQAIPIVYQVKPMVSNAKTLFKIANVVSSSNQKTNNTTTNSNTNLLQNKKETTNSPIFYI